MDYLQPVRTWSTAIRLVSFTGSWCSHPHFKPRVVSPAKSLRNLRLFLISPHAYISETKPSKLHRINHLTTADSNLVIETWQKASYSCFIENFFVLLLLLFEAEPCCVPQSGVYHLLLLPRHPECWDCRMHSPCPGSPSMAVINSMANTSSEKRGLLGLHLFIIVHHQKLGQKLKQGPWSNVSTDLLLQASSACIFYTTQKHQLPAPLSNRIGPPTLIANGENDPQICLSAYLLEEFSQLRLAVSE